MKEKQKKILELLLGIWVLQVVYIVLHEFGHCIVVWACGGKVTNFSIMTAHMSYDGENF